MATESPAVANSYIDVQAFINKQPLSRLQWLTYGLCFLIVAFDGFDTAALGFVAPSLRNEWSLSPAQLNPILVAALIGLMLGALVSGPLGDRYGRKRLLLGAVTWFGVWGLIAATSHSVESLTLFRFLAGLGLGGAMPNAITLTSEYCPARRHALLVTAMFCGFTLGSALGGVLAAHLLPTYGWSGVLFIGGLLPLLSLPLLAWGLPESVRFLVRRGATHARIARILARIGPLPAGTGEFRLSALDATPNSPIRQIFTAPWRAGTLALCCSFFMSLLIIYLLTNWLPILIKSTGRSQIDAAWIVTTFQFGGTAGAVVIGWFMDRLRQPSRLLVGTYVVGALFLAGIGQCYANLGGLIACIFGVGVCISGSQVGANALAAAFYPTGSRSTGVSWTLGAGRIGSIIGSLSGGALLSLNFGYTAIFSLLTVPALLAAIAISRVRPHGCGDGRLLAQPAGMHPPITDHSR